MQALYARVTLSINTILIITAAIYCANALPLRKRCFEITDDDSLLRDAEHRRWMMSMLLMGYRSGPTDERTFTRHDIIPFDRLPEELKMKDSYILEMPNTL